MTHARRVPVILLAAALVALCLVGQVGAVAPARAAGTPAPAKAGTPSEPAAASVPEARRSATLTLDAPLAAPAVEPAVPPSTRDGWTVLMTETFEGVWPPLGGLWTAFDNDGAANGEYFWDEDDYMFHNGTMSAWPAKGGVNGLDPTDYYYPTYVRSWMVYGPFDLSGASAANLNFWYRNQSATNYDWFFWGRSGDGADFTGTQVSGDSVGWQQVTLDLSAHLGDPSVWITFVFNSDAILNSYDGPFVDDITLNAYSGAIARDWTYMVYLDGDNNLEAAAVDDFLEMSSVGSTSQVAVVAQMDRIGGYDLTHDNWTDTRRFYITAGMTPTGANGTSIGEVNMGDPNTLVAFVQWAMANYPANHYALILWDHGSGWRSRALADPVTQGIAYDDTSGGDGLSMVELRNALSTLTGGGSNPFDLIGMDACLMAMIEVDDQLRPYADVRVTSQETEPNDGAPQDAILAALVAAPTMTTEALATVYVDEYYASYTSDFTQSAADLGADYAALRTAVDGFAAALLANGPANAAGIQAARTAVQDFFDVDYIDLYDFASRVNVNVANTAIDNAAAAVMAALGPATIHEHHGALWPDAHGLSIYFPKTLGEYDARYDGSSGLLQFTAATQWDEWLRAYYAYGTGPGLLGKSSPTDGATGMALSPTLSWGVSAGAALYEYCYDTTNDGACAGSWVSTGTATSAALSGLAYSTTYYWQVRAVNGFGTTYANGGAWWSFATLAPALQEMTFWSAGANDGWVLEQDEASGKGATFDAGATTGRVGDDASNRQWRSILHFDSSDLPNDAVIVGVTLKIKKQAIVGDSPFTTHGLLLVDMKTGYYHDIPALEKYDFQAAGSRGNVGRFIKTPTAGWYRAPLRARNYALVNLTGTTQFRLRFETDDNDDGIADYLSFYTGNAAAADRPQLIVTFYEP